MNFKVFDDLLDGFYPFACLKRIGALAAQLLGLRSNLPLVALDCRPHTIFDSAFLRGSTVQRFLPVLRSSPK